MREKNHVNKMHRWMTDRTDQTEINCVTDRNSVVSKTGELDALSRILQCVHMKDEVLFLKHVLINLVREYESTD